MATALIQSGTLKEGDAVVVGSQSGRVRAMFSDRGKKMQQAGPADPGRDPRVSPACRRRATPSLVVADERKARQIATVRAEREKLKGKGPPRITLEELHKQIESGEVKELRLILKADVQGSVEALTESLERLSTDEVKLKVIHGSVGAVNESDVMLASASNAIVLGFNVKADAKAAEPGPVQRGGRAELQRHLRRDQRRAGGACRACSRPRSARRFSAAPRCARSSPSRSSA